MSDTPRTDEHEPHLTVPIYFARTLERELAAAQAERDEYGQQVNALCGAFNNIRDTLRVRGIEPGPPLDEQVIALAQRLDAAQAQAKRTEECALKAGLVRVEYCAGCGEKSPCRSDCPCGTMSGFENPARAEIAKLKVKPPEAWPVAEIMACGHNGYWRTHYGRCMACQVEQANKEISELRKDREWHDVRESLPNTRCECLVFGKLGGISVGIFDPDKTTHQSHHPKVGTCPGYDGRFLFGGVAMQYGITHWTNLPPKPAIDSILNTKGTEG